MGQSESEEDHGDTEDGRDEDIRDGRALKSLDQQLAGVGPKGREGREATEEAGDKEGEDPTGMVATRDSSEEGTDEKAAEQIAGENAPRKTMKAGLLRKTGDCDR